MRVLHVIPGVAARYGGPSQAIVAMGQALATHHVEVLVATTNADGPGHLPVALGCPILYQGVPMLFFARQWHEGFKYSRPLAQWLATHVMHFDLVHIAAVFSHASLVAARACRRHGVPYVVRPLGTLSPWSLSQKRGQKRLLWHLGVRQMLHHAAAIHYTSVAEQRQSEGRLASPRGVVIPLGVDAALCEPAHVLTGHDLQDPALEKNPYVLVLSRLHPVKNLEPFLQAFLDVTRQAAWRHWRLVIAGTGDTGYVKKLAHIVNERGGTDHVCFKGWLEGTEKRAMLRHAALLAQPSRHESFGLSVVEALACGVPVLVSTGMGLAEEIRMANAGWVVDLQRYEMARGLEEALGQNEERIKRGRAGQTLVRTRFQWTQVAAQLVQLYAAILQHRPINLSTADT